MAILRHDYGSRCLKTPPTTPSTSPRSTSARWSCSSAPGRDTRPEIQSDARTDDTKYGTAAKVKTGKLMPSRRPQMAAGALWARLDWDYGISYSLILINSQASTPKDWAQLTLAELGSRTRTALWRKT